MRAITVSVAVLAILVGVSGSANEPAEAVFPGTNGKIAFHSDRDGNVEVYVMNADGSGQTRLTNNPAIDGQPTWSPDGTKIAFTSNRDGNHEIYVMNANGTGVTRITNSPADDASPEWSPDGSKLVYDSDRTGNFEVFVINVNGSGEKNLTNNAAEDSFPVWSPDGSRIAFESTRDGGDSDVFIMNSDGSAPTNITAASSEDEWMSTWSPDGSKLAFNRSSGENIDLYSVSAGGGPLSPISTSAQADYAASWSPDGVKLVFSSERTGKSQIYVTNYDGSGVTRLTNNSANDAFPDSQRLAAVTCTVASVIDGDSFTCSDGKTVDMLQIDAAELGQCGGAWSKAALENIFLAPGRVVRLDFDRTQTAGASTLAAPVAKGTDGIDYNLSIIMAYVGLAKAATVGASNTRFLDWANASQGWAQAAKWNMWAPGKTYNGGCE